MILRSDSALLVPVYRCRRGRQAANSSHASTNETVSRLHLLHLQSDAQPPPPPSGSGKGAVGRGLRLTSLVHPKHVSLKPISTTATKFLQAANEGVERCFPIEHEAIQQIKTSWFCPIVPNPLKKVLCTSIFQIQTQKMMHMAHENGVGSILNQLKFGFNPLVNSHIRNLFTNCFTKTFIKKSASLDSLAIGRIDFRHYQLQLNLKILGRLQDCQDTLHEVFS